MSKNKIVNAVHLTSHTGSSVPLQDRIEIYLKKGYVPQGGISAVLISAEEQIVEYNLLMVKYEGLSGF